MARTDIMVLYRRDDKVAEAIERAFKNGWACGHMSGGKDAYPGAAGNTCQEDLTAYKKKIAT